MYSTFNPSSYRPTQAPASAPATYDSKYGNDFVKVWAQRVAKETPKSTKVYPVPYESYQTPLSDNKAVGQHLPTPANPSTSRWSRPLQTTSYPMARQIPAASTPQVEQQTTLYHNDTLESPLTIQQRPPPSAVNGRYVLDIPQPSTTYAAPSPLEDILLYTPEDYRLDGRVIDQKKGMLPEMPLKVGDGFSRMKISDGRLDQEKIPIEVPPVSAIESPLPAEPLPSKVEESVTALYRMYQDPKTDYTEPSQATLAITLMNVLPPKADLMSPPSTEARGPDVTWEERDVIKDLVERFTIAIHSKAIERQNNGKPVKVGATQMLWELHFVALRRWGKYSLLAGHTEVLAERMKDVSP